MGSIGASVPGAVWMGLCISRIGLGVPTISTWRIVKRIGSLSEKL
jgi:hypothetical protein